MTPPAHPRHVRLPERLLWVLLILWRNALARLTLPDDPPDRDLTFLGDVPTLTRPFPANGTLAGDLMRAWRKGLGPDPKAWKPPPLRRLDLADLTGQAQGLSGDLTKAVTEWLANPEAATRAYYWPDRMRRLALRANATGKVLALRGTGPVRPSDTLENWAIARIERRYADYLRLMDRIPPSFHEDRLKQKANQIAQQAWRVFQAQIERAQEEIGDKNDLKAVASRVHGKLRERQKLALTDLLRKGELEAAQYLESLGRARMVIDQDGKTRLMLPPEGLT